MSKFSLLWAIAALSTMIATPVFAQAAIQEPGPSVIAFAFATFEPHW